MTDKVEKKPRAKRQLVTLNPKTFALLKEMADVMDINIASYLGSILDESYPMFEEVLKGMKELKKNNLKGFENLQKAIIETNMMSNEAQMDLLEFQKTQRLRKRKID